MQIRLDNYEKCYPKRLKRIFRSNINYQNYDSYIPYMKQATVGSLPNEIVQLFSKNKAQNIKFFQNALSDIVTYVRETRSFMDKKKHKLFDFEAYDYEKVAIYEKRLSKRLNSQIRRILPKGVTAELKFVDSGGFANVFKLSLKKKNGQKIMHDKAIKIFYNIQEPLNCHKPYHNNYAEANFWTFLKFIAGHKLDKTQFTRHYFSDLKSGYSITEFADKDICPTKKELSLTHMLHIFYSDYSNNKPIYGKFYDAGGFEKRKSFINDKVVWSTYKKMLNRNSRAEKELVISNLKNLVKNPKTPHRSKIKKAIELFLQDSKLIDEQSKKHLSRYGKFIKFIKTKLGLESDLLDYQ